jgi:tetratricopeptide (TPR) repeat protein
MIFKEAKCPSCGGELQLPPDKETAICMYCGSTVVVREAIKAVGGVNISNWMELARAAQKSSNNQEAFDYYTKVLEFEPQNYEAWFGKGETAGWMSTLQSPRLSELVTGFQKAMEYAPEDKKEETLSNIVSAINSIVLAYNDLAKKPYMDNLRKFYATNDMSTEDKWLLEDEYFRQVGEMILALKFAHTLSSDNRQIIKTIIFLTDGLSLYGSHYDKYDPEVWNDPRLKYRFRRGEFEDTVTSIRNQFISKMKQLDPSYQTEWEKQEVLKQGVSKQKSSKCFVVSATMGSPNHPIVELLREFRDQWLMKMNSGIMFFRFYNQFGPHLARIIERSRLLRYFTYFAIVRPLAQFARILLRNKEM